MYWKVHISFDLRWATTLEFMIDANQGQRPPRLIESTIVKQDLDDSLCDLIAHCWMQDPCKRPTAEIITGLRPPGRGLCAEVYAEWLSTAAATERIFSMQWLL
jgi:hypothetical protein